MSHQSISNALSSHLQSLPDLPPVRWENAPSTPETGTLYLAENYLPGNTGATGIENTASLDYTGIYQISIYAPIDDYKLVTREMTDKLASHFKRGTVVSFGGQDVRIVSVSVAAGDRRDAWFFTPVSVQWRAFSGNV